MHIKYTPSWFNRNKKNMKINFKNILAFALLITFHLSFAQKKDENIGTEVVNVVKPYTPTISDAFKVKEIPSLEDDDNSKKENIKYTIFSFPVASTFTPSKGKAAKVDESVTEKLYKNYFTGGIANYATLFSELYITENIGEDDYVAGKIKHLSSQGGIENVPVKDSFLKSSVDLTYGSKKSNFAWNTDLGYEIQRYHWYGLPTDYVSFYTNEQQTTIYNSIDKGQTYQNFYVGGNIKFNESIVNDISLKYNRFWDGYSSSENRFVAKPSFQFDIRENTIKTDLIVDYVGGTFAQDFSGAAPINYGFANFGIHPSYSMKKDDWSFDIGASAVYSLDNQSNSNQLFIYPQIKASLNVVGDLMIFYTGAEGGLDQNSYRDFTNENPFLSPSIGVSPTDRQYDFYAGLKGKLSNYVSYNIKGSATNEKNKGLFLSNPYDETILVKEEYKYGNSMGIVFDNVKTLRFFGELKADFSKNVSFGINGTFSSYTTAIQAEAWNLPAIQLGSNLNVTISPKWYAGADVFYVGQRKDLVQKTNIMTFAPENNIQTLSNYFDANAHVGYKYNSQFTAFLRLNNIANQGYQRWLNYPVQSFQVMIGGNYKFDF